MERCAVPLLFGSLVPGMDTTLYVIVIPSQGPPSRDVQCGPVAGRAAPLLDHRALPRVFG